MVRASASPLAAISACSLFADLAASACYTTRRAKPVRISKRLFCHKSCQVYQPFIARILLSGKKRAFKTRPLGAALTVRGENCRAGIGTAINAVSAAEGTQG